MYSEKYSVLFDSHLQNGMSQYSQTPNVMLVKHHGRSLSGVSGKFRQDRWPKLSHALHSRPDTDVDTSPL